MRMSNIHAFSFSSKDGLRIACRRTGTGRARLADPAALSKVLPDLPIYLFLGNEDTVRQQIECVRTLIDCCRKAGVRKVSNDFYEGGRHEMLNELNRGEVRTNLLVWLGSGLRGQSHHSEALWAQ